MQANYIWLTLKNTGLNSIGPLIRGFFFNKFIGKIFGDLRQLGKTVSFL